MKMKKIHKLAATRWWHQCLWFNYIKP